MTIGEHRRLGYHITFVRSCKLDKWTADEIVLMESVGNAIANQYWEGGKKGSSYGISPNASQEERRRYINKKYIRKEMVTANAVNPYDECQRAKNERREPVFSTSITNIEKPIENKTKFNPPKLATRIEEKSQPIINLLDSSPIEVPKENHIDTAFPFIDQLGKSKSSDNQTQPSASLYHDLLDLDLHGTPGKKAKSTDGSAPHDLFALDLGENVQSDQHTANGNLLDLTVPQNTGLNQHIVHQQAHQPGHSQLQHQGHVHSHSIGRTQHLPDPQFQAQPQQSRYDAFNVLNRNYHQQGYGYRQFGGHY